MSSTVHKYAMRPFRRHSLVLLVAGVVYSSIGFTYVAADPVPERLIALEYAIYIMSYSQWGYLFIAAGILAITSSRWPQVSETWGYSVLTGLSVLWGGMYAAPIVFGDASAGSVTAPLVWGLIGFLWWAISGLINPRSNVLLLDQIRILQHENLELYAGIERLLLKEE